MTSDSSSRREPWFDEEIFASLRETVSEEILERLLKLFLENTSAKFEEIRTIDPLTGAEDLAMALHALKGSALMVGARELEKTAENLRGAARRGEAETISGGVEKLAKALEKVHERIGRELSST